MMLNPKWFTARADPNAYCAQAFRGSWESYIEFNQHFIHHQRTLTEMPCSDDIVSMNMPFAMGPNDASHGVLLIHGFMGSPYIMRAIAQTYADQGIRVLAILLPGHGTSPGALSNVKIPHWVKAVNYGIQELKNSADHVHLCGFSLGAALAINALKKHTISSLALLAPAIKLNKPAFMLPWLQAISQLPGAKRLQWSYQSQEYDAATYRSFPISAAYEVWKLLKYNRALSQDRLNVPCWASIAHSDATVSPQALKHLLNRWPHHNKKLYYYGNMDDVTQSIATVCIDDTQLDPQIMMLSHVALPVQPDDQYYGQTGDFQTIHPDTKLGEWSPKILRDPKFKRLTFNPDFSAMADDLKQFYSEILHD